MIDQTTFQILVSIITLTVVAGVFFIMMEAMRLKWGKTAREKLLIEIRTPIGTIERHLVGRDENVLEAKGTDGHTYNYIISEKDVYRDAYPPGIPSFMQSVIGKAYYDEGITNPNTRTQISDAEKDARILARAREKSQVDADARELNRTAGGGGGNFNTIQIVLLIVMMLASVAGAYFGYIASTNSQLVRDAILGTAQSTVR